MSSIYQYLPCDSDWQMDPGERLAMVALLAHLRPKVSLEIGSKYGGSLAVLSSHSERVVSLDVDPEVPTRLARFRNVEFVIGDSRKTLPAVLARLRSEGAALGFALVDGDHSTAGVREDCRAFLAERPIGTLYVAMHDSFNPEVREGILSAGWESCPYVHSFELDLVPGSMKHPPLRRQLWGGIGLAILKPEPRQGPLALSACSDVGYRTLKALSVHNVPVRRAMQVGDLLRGNLPK